MSYLLSDKLEAAFVVVLDAVADASALVVPGKNYEDKTFYPDQIEGEPPQGIVICSASGEGEEDPKGTGNFWIGATIAIKSLSFPNPDGTNPADNPKTPNEALVSVVHTALMDDGLSTSLSAAVDDFTVFPQAIIVSAPTRSQDEAGAWVDEIALRIYCCARDI
jgi:hypothetical protein